MLGNDTLVLHGHFPAGEGHEPGAERAMPVVERSPQQCLHAARMLMNAGRAAGGWNDDGRPTLRLKEQLWGRPCRLADLGSACREGKPILSQVRILKRTSTLLLATRARRTAPRARP